jgi:hypothetical protein
VGLETLDKAAATSEFRLLRERLGNRPPLLRCRTPCAVWTVKRPVDCLIGGAQYFLEMVSTENVESQMTNDGFLLLSLLRFVFFARAE